MSKRFWFYIIFAFATLTTGWAQAPHSCSNPNCPTRTAEDEAGKMTEMMVRDLGLTDTAQIARIYALHLQFAIARKSQTEPSSAEQHQARMASFMTHLKAILSPEQYNRFMTVCRNREPRHPQGAHITH